jgi:transcriptional regulator with XRE-family HTH domain
VNNSTATFSGLLKRRREDLGLTHLQLASKLDRRSGEFISLVESGKPRFDLNRVPDLARVRARCEAEGPYVSCLVRGGSCGVYYPARRTEAFRPQKSRPGGFRSTHPCAWNARPARQVIHAPSRCQKSHRNHDRRAPSKPRWHTAKVVYIES